MYHNIFNLMQNKMFLLKEYSSKLKDMNQNIEFLNTIISELANVPCESKPLDELIKNWPIAIHDDFICRPGDELIKAESIMNFFVVDSVKDKDVLVLGDLKKELSEICIKQGAKSVNNDCLYDMIIAYDVFDYRAIPISIDGYKSKLKDDGKMYVRFHPWCSRTGGRLHQDLNLAWAHLVFSPQELFDIFHYTTTKSVFPVLKPIEEYDKIVAAFKVIHKNVVREDIEDFFYRDSYIIKRICSHYDKFDGLILPVEHLSILYVDMILGK